MGKSYIVIAKKISKYGQILYCVEVKNGNIDIDMSDVYIQTFYFKGKSEIKINEIYDFSVVKGENGYIYAFEC